MRSDGAGSQIPESDGSDENVQNVICQVCSANDTTKLDGIVTTVILLILTVL